MKTKFGSAKKAARQSPAVNSNRHNHEMPKAKSIDEIWLENFRKLMGFDVATGRSAIPQSFMVPRIAQATIGRLLRGDNQPNLATVNMIAHEFQAGGGLLKPGKVRLEGWQLLVEGFDPAYPPRLITSPQIAKLRDAVHELIDPQVVTISKKANSTNMV